MCSDQALVRRTVTAAGRSVENENIASVHFNLITALQFDGIPVSTLDPGSPHLPWFTTRHSIGRHLTVTGYDRCRHVPQEPQAPVRAVTSNVPAAATRTSANA